MPDGREIALRAEDNNTYHIADEPNEPLGRLVSYPETGNFDFVMPDGGAVIFVTRRAQIVAMTCEWKR